jgi:uncharacterized DUF497 family protein
MKFEWDENKNKTNIQIHGIDFRDAIYIFSDPFQLNMLDNEHPDDEERWIILGKNLNDTLLLVVHVFRDNDFTRIISARKATRNEQRQYTQRLSK